MAMSRERQDQRPKADGGIVENTDTLASLTLPARAVALSDEQLDQAAGARAHTRPRR